MLRESINIRESFTGNESIAFEQSLNFSRHEHLISNPKYLSQSKKR